MVISLSKIPSIHILQAVHEAGMGVRVHKLNDWYPAVDARGHGGSVSPLAHVNIDTVVADLKESCCIFPVQPQLESSKPHPSLSPSPSHCKSQPANNNNAKALDC